MGQLQKRLKPGLLGSSKAGNGDNIIRSTNHRADGDHPHIDQ
jgi:hypothetical protein